MSTRAKILICICILSLAVSLIFVFVQTDVLMKDNEYTRMDDAVTTSKGIYYAHNRNNSGFVFRLDPSGKVLNLADSRAQGEVRVEAVDYLDDNVHVLYSSARQHDDEYGLVYHIVTYDPELKALKSSVRFVPDEDGIIKGFKAEGERYYLTYISKDGKDLRVYEVLFDDLLNLEDQYNKNTGEDVNVLESILGKTSMGETFYADALYTSSVLFLRGPGDKPDGVFRVDPVVINAVSKMKLSFSQYLLVNRTTYLIWAGALTIWIILVFLGIGLLQNRDRMFYEAVLMEALLFIVMVGSFTFAGAQYRLAAVRDVNKYADMTLTKELAELGDLDKVNFYDENFYVSGEYKRIQNSLSDFAGETGNSEIFTDIFVMRLSDRQVMVGVSGRNREDASLIYGSVMEDLRKGFSVTEQHLTEETYLEGDKCYVVGISTGKYAIVGVASVTEDMIGFWGDFRLRIIVFVAAYLLVGGIILLIIYFRARDLKVFEYVISEAAMGRMNVKVPENAARDMRSMWRSLSELVKKIDQINYSKFKIFEAYYRFAPKNIETIMGKDNITEVKNGDVTETRGIMMLVTSGGGYGEKQIHALNNIIYFMEEYADRGEGVLVSEDSALSMLQFLFLKGDSGIINRATQFLHSNQSDKEAGNLSVFLYHATFMYGIVGTQTQSLTYLSFKYARELEAYARWFKELKLSLVITEEVRLRDNPGQIRYIGYIMLSDNEKHMLYEVLDACTARERQIKLVNKEKFEATLELFYQKDFYLARNQFSELLRELPEDEVVKWYLFESEKYLNDFKVDEHFGELRITER